MVRASTTLPLCCGGCWAPSLSRGHAPWGSREVLACEMWQWTVFENHFPTLTHQFTYCCTIMFVYLFICVFVCEHLCHSIWMCGGQRTTLGAGSLLAHMPWALDLLIRLGSKCLSLLSHLAAHRAVYYSDYGRPSP